MFEASADVIIIGGGPAGLSAAVAAKKNGAEDVLIVERDYAIGGILQQCIHPGFGLTYFDEELTGPEYYLRFAKEAHELGVRILLNTMVLEIYPSGKMLCTNSQQGMMTLHGKTIILTMGCRERTRGNLAIPGSRPSGVYTAGTAQRLINMQNRRVGEKIVILGSGDIGMIMARRLSLEGAEIIAVVEVLDYLSGLTRNKVQCLDDFDIPLIFRHTVTKIHGNRRVEGVTISKVDENRTPIAGTEQYIECDTLLLSVGLIPENELSRALRLEMSERSNGPVVNQYMQTSQPHVFACGNVVHVNDLVDNVSTESEIAGTSAAQYLAGNLPAGEQIIKTIPGENVSYVSPNNLVSSDEEQEINLYFRVSAPLRDAWVTVLYDGEEIYRRKRRIVTPGEMERVSIALPAQADKEIIVNAGKEDA